jgi:hypothetical protein
VRPEGPYRLREAALSTANSRRLIAVARPPEMMLVLAVDNFSGTINGDPGALWPIKADAYTLDPGEFDALR